MIQGNVNAHTKPEKTDFVNADFLINTWYEILQSVRYSTSGVDIIHAFAP